MRISFMVNKWNPHIIPLLLWKEKRNRFSQNASGSVGKKRNPTSLAFLKRELFPLMEIARVELPQIYILYTSDMVTMICSYSRHAAAFWSPHQSVGPWSISAETDTFSHLFLTRVIFSLAAEHNNTEGLTGSTKNTRSTWRNLLS